ncbi:class I adenylate-forming enzyme family protein [Paenibacillus alginolyticus]|uniref:Acyl--CoA ligase n=1 Tax=Paenibacillus alginolyticus TaxID=59839 RepID=A0ABT4GNT6_9BACL|nr:class I adenylate-forming enzyme family protein [Paenibacillus alginolyticus]MCY9697871.1 acyl--CoA ligase [Paenibacillus alginolyticus]MEC0147724.1 class I adenylate-forming enzyme family protein [Paenibacillus alginolyticus]
MSTLKERFVQTQDRTKTVLTTFYDNYSTADLEQQTEFYLDLLRKKNIKGKKIGVLVPPVFSYLSLIMAINQLGGVVVPLSWQYRKDDLKQILRFLEPHIVFSITNHGGFPFSQAIEEWASESETLTILYKSEDCFRWEEFSIGVKEKPLEISSIDFICCTSGSTGVPKGMMFKTDDIEIMAQYLRELPDMRTSDRFFMTAPPTSVIGIAALSVGFKEGLQIVFPDSFEIPLMVKLMKDTNINKMLTTPSILKALYPFMKQMAPEIVGNLEFCGLSGEVVTEEIAVQIPLNDHCRLIGLYGSSEMGGILYCNLREKAEWSVYRGVEYKIDQDGEFLIRTLAGFMGYYKQPDLTSELWTSDGWFLTGDLVRMNENHNLEIIGRKKDVIKKGGQQVVPGEVEKILLQHPNVKQAVVLGAPHSIYGEQVVAFAILHDESRVKELYPYCAERIARYKVPDTFEIVSDIPIVQGKTDKISLLKQYLSRKG